MTTWLQRAALILLPGGLLLYCASLCFRCRHRRELACTLPNGSRGLQCANCLRTRPHPWGGTEPRYRRTQEVEPSGNSGELTGIARVMAEAGQHEWHAAVERMEARR